MYKVFTADSSEIYSHSIEALCHLIRINSSSSDRFHRNSLKNRNTILINIEAKILELTLFSVMSWPLMPSPRSSSSRRSSTPEMADEQDWEGSIYFSNNLNNLSHTENWRLNTECIQYTENPKTFNVFVLYLMSTAIFISDDLVSIIWRIGQINTCPRELVSDPGLVKPGVFVTEFWRKKIYH